MVVVSRWFGGLLLGPARFMYITDAARGMLDQGGYTQQAPTAAPKAAQLPDLQPMEESSSEGEEVRTSRQANLCWVRGGSFEASSNHPQASLPQRLSPQGNCQLMNQGPDQTWVHSYDCSHRISCIWQLAKGKKKLSALFNEKPDIILSCPWQLVKTIYSCARASTLQSMADCDIAPGFWHVLI